MPPASRHSRISSPGRLSDTGTPGADPGGLPKDASGPAASRPVLAPVPGRHLHAYGLDLTRKITSDIQNVPVSPPPLFMSVAWWLRRYPEAGTTPWEEAVPWP